MIKCRIHVQCEKDYMDKHVYVEINLPCLPPVGSVLNIGEELKENLKKMAISDIKIATKYAPKWFYNSSFSCSMPKENNLKDLSFDDAAYVSTVSFYANKDYVDIEISDINPARK